MKAVRLFIAAALPVLVSCAPVRTTTQVCEQEVGACGARPAAPLAQAEPKREKPVRYADANNDGKVTREEARIDRALAAAFDDYDRNGDGALDRAEFAQLVADGNKRRPPRQEFAKAESPPEPAQEEWRCHEVNHERHCPGARARAE